ncbi:ChrR family anti-sigma-E factor [Pararhodobacter sp. SW119]|uniref:ChrR family anti-sigma-E factor n=1 Tax=Pararhodobacter sp. SW119 TaxID=2780075 RepID=UPI001ADFEE2F|nr:ChrR family anti-sigma-E factor [Pararhodobacter sp. SW119]
MIRHHLNDALLMAYSAGQLPEAFNLAVAAHVSLCDECRARLESFDAVGGVLLDDCSGVSLSENSFAATMARIKAGDPQPRSPRQAVPRGVFPAPLRDYVGGDLDAVRWRSVGGGVRQAILATDRDATARLLYIPGGVAVPDHGHRGTELTLVLQGAFRDEVDRFGRGDIEIATEELDHTPVAEEGDPCVCLAVTDAPLRFNSFVPRILQPFLRI